MGERKKVTAPMIMAMKGKKRIVAVTAYDATFARLVDMAEVDLILVGDSLGMVVQGNDHTLGVRLEHMLYHTSAVTRGRKYAHVVMDLPFGYTYPPEKGVEAAVRAVSEAGAEAVKIEGYAPQTLQLIQILAGMGIPVVGHIGLTPQWYHAFGGFKIQGRSEEDATRLMVAAKKVERAGAYALVLESIPQGLAARITAALSIPTIGIGAGPACDGQVLVIYDLLGADERFKPRFLRKYADLSSVVRDAVSRYAKDVQDGTFPGPEESHG